MPLSGIFSPHYLEFDEYFVILYFLYRASE